MRDSVKNTLNISLIFKATIAFALMVVAFSILSYASIYFYYIRNIYLSALKTDGLSFQWSDYPVLV